MSLPSWPSADSGVPPIPAVRRITWPGGRAGLIESAIRRLTGWLSPCGAAAVAGAAMTWLFWWVVVMAAGDARGPVAPAVVPDPVGPGISSVFTFWFLLRFGVLRRLGLRAVEASLPRRINDSFVGQDVRTDLPGEDAVALLGAIERFPRFIGLYVVGLGLVVAGAGMARNIWSAGPAPVIAVRAVLAVMVVAAGAAAAELLAEFATSRSRFDIRREIHRRAGTVPAPLPRSSLALKLGFVLMVIVWAFGVGVVLTPMDAILANPVGILGPPAALALTVGFALRLLLVVIRRDMHEVRVAVADLAAGGTGALHTGSLDREMIDLAGSVSALAESAAEARAALEVRTRDLATLTETLERQVERRAGAIRVFNERLEALNAISADVAEKMEVRRIADVVVDRLPALLGARNCSVFLHEEGEGVLRMVAHNLEGVPHDPPPETPLDADSVTTRCFRADRSLFVRDIEKELGLPRRDRYRTGSFMSLLMKRGDRKVGIVHLSDKTGADAFDENDLRLAQTFTDHLAAAFTNARLFDRARHDANTDQLTGLMNRRFFVDRLNQEIGRAQRFGGTFTLAMMDLDDLKRINDSFGHLAGDAVLRWVADVLRSITRGVDVAARHGGDEVAVLLIETPLAGAQVWAERVRMAVRQGTLIWQGKHVRATVSIGLAQWTPGMLRDDLIGVADKAAYQAKNAGKDSVAVA
ncbi:MAG: sensor domain-containing diguanylate cyclase [Myxococcota bacterium]|nr:sensor domain-containing diguanylate cyclase [Myxococcota bacterium]